MSPTCQFWWPHCSSGHTVILGCHMISQDDMSKGSCDFSYHPAMFGSHGHCNSEDIILVCHVILQDHVIKGHMILWAEACQGNLPSDQVR